MGRRQPQRVLRLTEAGDRPGQLTAAVEGANPNSDLTGNRQQKYDYHFKARHTQTG